MRNLVTIKGKNNENPFIYLSDVHILGTMLLNCLREKLYF